jgi:flagellar basal body-associated protein FliL
VTTELQLVIVIVIIIIIIIIIIITIIIIIIITTENSHIGHCTHTSESANVKTQNSQRRNWG